MKTVQILRNQAVVADQCAVAVRFMDRFFGLMGAKELASGQGMFFPKCNDIHMWFMRIPIDVVFLRKDLVVTSVHAGVRPWRPLPLRDGRASEALELPQGTIARHGITPGDQLCIS